MMNTGEALQGCWCLYVKVIPKKESELYSVSVPDMFLPFSSPGETLYLPAGVQEALCFSNKQRYEGEMK